MIAMGGRGGSGDKQTRGLWLFRSGGGRREWKLEGSAGRKRQVLCSVGLVLKLETFSPFLRTREEAEFENKGKKRRPDGVKSLC